MEIKEAIEQAKLGETLKEILAMPEGGFLFKESELISLLELVCRGQNKEAERTMLKQTYPMIHKNGYGCDAVPKSTILSLSKLTPLITDNLVL